MEDWEGESEKLQRRAGEGDAPMAAIDAEGCPVTALGKLKGKYWFFSPSGEEREVPYRQLFMRDGLEDLFEGDTRWLRENFNSDEKGGYSVARAGSWLLRECVKAGIFDPAIQRRLCGVWRAQDELVVHCGDRVLVNGEFTRAGFRREEILYPLATKMTPPAYPPATAADGERLLEAIRCWQFEDSAGPEIVLGFIGQALLGAAPDWRTHCFVRSPYGGGKTWLGELVANATGARLPNNNVTPANIYQSLTGEARAMIIDEAEKSERDDRIVQVIELVRLMSGRDGGRIGRGSADGSGARSYQVNGSAFLLAILHPDLRPQDASRFIVLRLRPLPTGRGATGLRERALQALRLASELSPHLLARAIQNWHRFLDTVAIYREACIREDVEPRSADSLAAVLAGRDLLIRDDLPGASEVDGDLARVAHLMIRADDRQADSEGQQCLIHLLSSSVEKWSSGERMTVGEKIQEAQEPGAHRNGINRILGRAGLRLVYGKDAKTGQSVIEFLLIAHRHVGLEHIFAGTRWNGAVWKQALEDLRGAAPWGQSTHFGGSPSVKALALPGFHLPRPEGMEDRDNEGPDLPPDD